MRTKKWCTAEQFDLAVANRQFGDARKAAARLVLVDRLPTTEVAETTGCPIQSLRRAVQLIAKEVEALPAGPRPGYTILKIEVPEPVGVEIAAKVAASKGKILEEMHHAAE